MKKALLSAFVSARRRDVHVGPALLPHVMLDAEDGALFGRLALKGSTQHPLPGAGPGNASRNGRAFRCSVKENVRMQNRARKTTELSQSFTGERDSDIPLIELNLNGKTNCKALRLVFGQQTSKAQHQRLYQSEC